MKNSSTSPLTANTFLGIRLNEGVFRGHMVTFYLSCYAAIMLATTDQRTGHASHYQ